MYRRHFLLSSVLFVLLFFGLTGEVLGDVAAQLEQANAYLKKEKYDKAEELYKQILAVAPVGC